MVTFQVDLVDEDEAKELRRYGDWLYRFLVKQDPIDLIAADYGRCASEVLGGIIEAHRLMDFGAVASDGVNGSAGG
jgi:hypothetical protein